MERPRPPGAGITGAWKSLSGENSTTFVATAGFQFNRLRDAARLDRAADLALFEGRRALAERLSHAAEAMREGGGRVNRQQRRAAAAQSRHATFISDPAQIEAVCSRLAAAQAAQLPLSRAAAERKIAVVAIADPEAEWPHEALDREKRPVVILVGADRGDGNDSPPDAWRCVEHLRRWCRSAIVHGASGEADHYRLAAAVAEVRERLVLVECSSADEIQSLIGCTIAVLGSEAKPLTPDMLAEALDVLQAGQAVLLAADRRDLRDRARREVLALLGPAEGSA